MVNGIIENTHIISSKVTKFIWVTTISPKWTCRREYMLR